MKDIRQQILTLIKKKPLGNSGYGWAPREIRKILNIGPKEWRKLTASMYADQFLVRDWEKDKSKASLVTIGNTKGLKYTLPKTFDQCFKFWRDLLDQKYQKHALILENPPKIPHPRLQKVFDISKITKVLDFELWGIWSTNRQLSTLAILRPSLRKSDEKYDYAKVWVKEKYIELWNSNNGFHGKKLDYKTMEYK